MQKDMGDHFSDQEDKHALFMRCVEREYSEREKGEMVRVTE